MKTYQFFQRMSSISGGTGGRMGLGPFISGGAWAPTFEFRILPK